MYWDSSGETLQKQRCIASLKEQSIPVGMQLPGNSSVKEIETAPQAAVNLVVHPVGLSLAKKMKKKVWHTVYVVFLSAIAILTESITLIKNCLKFEKQMPEKAFRLASEKAKERTEKCKADFKRKNIF